MQLAARRFLPTPLHTQQQPAPDGVPSCTYTLNAGVALPEHDEELSIVGREQVLWTSGLAYRAAPPSSSSSSEQEASGVQLPDDHTWGTRVMASLRFPSAHPLSGVPPAQPGTEAPVRGSLGGGGPVLAAAWACFADARAAVPVRQLCVLQRHSLHVVSAEGEVATVQLPYRARAMWGLLEGLLIERDEVDSSALDPALVGSDALDVSMDSLGRPRIPTLFSLLHPLEELKPVSVIEREDSECDEPDADIEPPQAVLLSDSDEHVVYTCTAQPFVLTYHSQRRVHSLWLIRQSRREIYKRLKLDGNAGVSADASINASMHAVAGAAGSSSSVSAAASASASRRQSMGTQGGWHGAHAPHLLSPVHQVVSKESDVAALSSPARIDAGSNPQMSSPAKNSDAAFYQQFLFRQLAQEHTAAQPSSQTAAEQTGYHAAAVGSGAFSGVDDAACIHPELLLERSWTQAEPVSHACSSAFLSSTADNEPLLCLFTAATGLFQAFLLTSSLAPRCAAAAAASMRGGGAPTPVPQLHLTPLFTASFLSVVPVYAGWSSSFAAGGSANPYATCILALERTPQQQAAQQTSSSRLTLFQGQRKITHVEVTDSEGRSLLASSPAATSSGGAAALLGAGVNLQRGGAAVTPFKASMDATFASHTSSFTPLDPNSTAAALFLRTPGVSTGAPDAVTHPAELRDPVGNRVTLRLSDGSHYRLSVPTHFFSPLVHTCMASLACSLSTDLLCALRADVVQLRTAVCTAEGLRRQAPSGENTPAQQPTEQHEWQAFVLLIRHLLHYDTAPTSGAAAATTCRSSAAVPKGDAAWQRLLASSTHKAHLRHTVLQHLSSSAQAVNEPEASPAPAVELSWLALATAPALFSAELPALFLCLHLVYEDLKLPVVRSPCGSSSAPAPLRLCAELLKPLATACARADFLDAYQRAHGSQSDAWSFTAHDASRWGCMLASIDGGQAALDEALPKQPPSIHAFIMQRLHASASGSAAPAALYPLPVVPQSLRAAHGARAVHNFLLGAGLEQPFAWSRKVLLFYDLLTEEGSGGSALPRSSANAAAPSDTLGVPPAHPTRSLSGAGASAARSRVQVSDCILSPYALPMIEQRQVELQRSALIQQHRTWSLHGGPQSGASTVVNTPAPAKAAVTTPAHSFSSFTPAHRTPLPASLAHAPHLLLSPLLTPPFPAVGGSSTSGARATAAQHKRVHTMQLMAAAAAAQSISTLMVPNATFSHAASAGAALGAGSSAQASPMRMDDDAEHPAALSTAVGARKKPKHRVSFGANTTAATPKYSGGAVDERSTAESPAAASPASSSFMQHHSLLRSPAHSSSDLANMSLSVLGVSAPDAASFPVFAPSTLSRALPRFLSRSAAEAVVLAMVSEQFTLEHLAMLPAGLAVPLWEALQMVREKPPLDIQVPSPELLTGVLAATGRSVLSMWPREAYTLIGREDLGRMFSSLHAAAVAPSGHGVDGSSDPHTRNASSSISSNSSSLAPLSDPERSLDEELEVAAGRPADTELDETAEGAAPAASASTAAGRLAAEPADLDGTLLVQRQAALRFGRDQRLKEVRHLLRSDRVLCVSVDRSVRLGLESGSIGGGEAAAEHQSRLGIVARRALSLPTARGMYTLASIQPSLAESLPLPSLLLRGRVPPHGSLIDLDLTAQLSVSQESLPWPEFHNGVAAALRILPAQRHTGAQDAVSRREGQQHKQQGDEQQDGSDADLHSSAAPVLEGTSFSVPAGQQITRTWIVYNRPTQHSSASASASSSSVMVGGLSHAHAGFLFGLGLAGHLSVLSVSDLFWYLSAGHEPTALAMLLGMAACRRGSQDTTVSKMLTLHVPALLPASFADMNIPSSVQSCALLGLGLLYQGSAHRLMAEVLLNEIGRRPGTLTSANGSTAAAADESFILERENYALSAGLGLGLLLLGRGGDSAAMSGLADLELDKKLSAYIHGGKDVAALHRRGVIGGAGRGAAGAVGAEDDDDAAAAGGVGWMSSGLPRRGPAGGAGDAESRARAQRAGRNAQFHASSAAAALAAGKNSRVQEGSLVNIDVTAPGAMLALALLYLQSDNALIASRLRVPDTHYALDFVRADFVYLRVLARHMIQWSSVPEASTQELLTSNVPDLFANHVMSLRFYMPKWQPKQPNKTQKREQRKQHAMSDDDQAAYDVSDEEEDESSDEQQSFEEHDGGELVSDACDGFTAAPVLPSASMSSSRESGGGESAGAAADADYSSMRQAYLHVVSANCFALGLKYSGTCSRRVVAMLVRILKALRAVAKRRASGGDFAMHTLAGLLPAAQLHKTDRATLDTCIVSVATALALVLAGSGHLGALRLFRGLLKQRADKSTPSGWHARLAMCVGLLFLAGGRCTIDTSGSSPAAQANIAYCLIAFYPHLAYAVEEQRYHAQIYRHLYVLATSQRGLQTIDVDTGMPCYVPLEVLVQEGVRRTAAAEPAKKQPSAGGQKLIPPTVVAARLKRLRFITPCLLPAYDTIHRISIVSPRFHALELHLRPTMDDGTSHGHPSSSAAQRSLLSAAQLTRIYVKKKLGFESYERDPRGLRSIRSRSSFPSAAAGSKHLLAADDSASSSLSGSKQRAELLRSFSAEPRLLAFVQLFLSGEAGSGSSAPSAAATALSAPLRTEGEARSQALSDYLAAVLVECLQEEKFFQMVHVYLQLFPLAMEPPLLQRQASAAESAPASLYIRSLESTLTDPELVWSLVMLREYYQRFRPAQQQQQQGGQQQEQPATPAGKRTRRSAIVNATQPFHTLPLAEGSASVELADPDSENAAASVAGAGAAPPSKPLLALAFLDAVLHRVDGFFAEHAPLQHEFAAYVRRVADGQQMPPSGSGQAHGHLTHPLLGSLLVYWQIPPPHSLRTGLHMLRQVRVLALASVQRPLLAALLWPALSPAASRAILQAQPAV